MCSSSQNDPIRQSHLLWLYYLQKLALHVQLYLLWVSHTHHTHTPHHPLPQIVGRRCTTHRLKKKHAGSIHTGHFEDVCSYQEYTSVQLYGS